MTVKSNLPIGAGLGSSAAYAVCIAAGLLAWRHAVTTPFDDSSRLLINAWAFEAEKIMHGNPSGIDNCVSTYGHEIPKTWTVVL